MQRWRFPGLFLMDLHSGAGEGKGKPEKAWNVDEFVGEITSL